MVPDSRSTFQTSKRETLTPYALQGTQSDQHTLENLWFQIPGRHIKLPKVKHPRHMYYKESNLTNLL